jgi:hypothetical protein
MPIYIYKHPRKEEYEEVVQSMNEPHTFSKEGVEWKRVFLSPNAAISANDDPFNGNNYVEKTANMKGTVGDLMDYSAELSQKRAEACGGVDPIKQKSLGDYSKRTGGKIHPSELGKKKIFESKDIKVDLD